MPDLTVLKIPCRWWREVPLRTLLNPGEEIPLGKDPFIVVRTPEIDCVSPGGEHIIQQRLMNHQCEWYPGVL